MNEGVIPMTSNTVTPAAPKVRLVPVPGYGPEDEPNTTTQGGTQDGPARKFRLVPIDPPASAPRETAPPLGSLGPAKSLQYGTQETLSGIANVVGTPVDLLSAVINAALGAVEMAGVEGVPYIENPVGGSKNLRSMARGLFEGVGGEVVEESAVPSKQRIAGDIVNFGTQGLIGGALLAGPKAAALAPRALTQPYAANAPRVVAGDAAAGLGSGAVVGSYQEAVPEDERHPLVEMLLAMIGGTGAAAGKNLAEGVATNSLPARGVPADPATGKRTSNKVAGEAARFLQAQATNPQAASRSIAAAVDEFGRAGLPPIGSLANDPGLSILQGNRRALDPRSFLEAEGRLQSRTLDEMESLRPAGADPALVGDVGKSRREYTASRDAARTAAATERLESAGAAERGIGDRYAGFADGATPASEALDRAIVDETYLPRRAEKNTRYADADPSGTVPVDPVRTRSAARLLQDELDALPPSFRALASEGGMVGDLTGLPSDQSLRSLIEMKRRTSLLQSEAQKSGRFSEADAFGTVGRGMSADVQAAARSGAPGTERLAEAERFYKEDFAPFFREGFGTKDFFKAIDRDPTRSATPRSRTAEIFLRAGAGGAEAAASLRKIMEIAPNPDAARDAARRYVLADLAKVIGPDGAIHPMRLNRWLAARSGMLREQPDIGMEVLRLRNEVGTAAERTSRLGGELKALVKNAEMQQRDFDKSALALFIDADPKRAVADLLRSRDPVARVAELRRQISGNAPAEAGLKAAVADHMVEMVTQARRAADADADAPFDPRRALRHFRENEKALEAVFGEDMPVLRRSFNRISKLIRDPGSASAGRVSDGQVPDNSLAAMALRPVEFIARLAYGALEGGSKVRKYRILSSALPNSAAAADALVGRAMFDPDVARHLLERPVNEIGSPAWNSKLNKLLGVALTQRTDAGEQENE